MPNYLGKLLAVFEAEELKSEVEYDQRPPVKGHNRIIFDKLQVKRRTEAVARARKLGLL